MIEESEQGEFLSSIGCIVDYEGNTYCFAIHNADEMAYWSCIPIYSELISMSLKGYRTYFVFYLIAG